MMIGNISKSISLCRLSKLYKLCKFVVIRSLVVEKSPKSSSRIKIDRSGLLKPHISEDQQNTNLLNKEPMSELAKVIKNYIKLRGPISVHEFMTLATNSKELGYYQNKSDKIGSSGDFITSPEISQIFGEMIGIWAISVWEQMGCPEKINLVEMGPGLGTLMKDITRTFAKFPLFKKALSISLLELSPEMIIIQKSNLLGITETTDCEEDKKNTSNQTKQLPNKKSSLSSQQNGYNLNGIPIKWYNFLREIPNDVPTLYIGQEFLDTFPVHQFVYTKSGWRERLVDIDSSSDSKAQQHFKFVLSPSITPAILSILRPADSMMNKNELIKNFSSNLKSPLPIISSGQDKPLHSSGSSLTQKENLSPEKLQVGDGIEVNPLAWAAIEDVSNKIKITGGAALFFDYGERHPQEDTLRAYKKHKQVHVLSEPGIVDITTDIDFSACENIALRTGICVHESITQGEFLVRMGAVSRIEQLLNHPNTSDEAAEFLVASFKKIVDENEMGKRFKVLGLSNIKAVNNDKFNMPGFPNNK